MRRPRNTPPQEITRLINERNESEFARKATQSGGSLTVVRGRALRRAAASRRSPNPLARLPLPQIRPPPDAKAPKAAKGKPSLKGSVLSK